MSFIRYLFLRFSYAKPPLRLRWLRKNLRHLNISSEATRLVRFARDQREVGSA